MANATLATPTGGGTRARKSRGVLYWFAVPFAWLLAVVDVLLVLWMLMSSFKTTRQLTFSPWSWPKPFRWSNYATAWTSASIGAGVYNSLILVFVAGVGTIVVTAPAAYALSRFGVRGSASHTLFFVIGLGIPGQAMYIPLYVLFSHIHLINSIWGLAIIYIGGGIPYTLFLLTAFFRSLPRELEEAAAIDGASPNYTFWVIMLPLARSGLITVFVLHAMGIWTETFFALVMLQNKTTISLALYNFLQTMQYTGARYSVLLAGLMIVILPLFVLYIFLGRRIIEGIAAGYSR